MSPLLFICLVLPYCILLLVLTVGVVSTQKSPESYQPEAELISVVIAARNEENNIDKAIKSILEQDYPTHCYEIILIDDHSEDATFSIIPNSPLIRIVTLPEGISGKKAALHAGVALAKFPYIAVTDADCIANPLWLKTLASIIRNKKSALIVGPVSLTHSNSALATFQHWEFRALQMVTFGSAAIKIPTLCNGANLCFSKVEYITANLKGEETPSGDDIFLLHHLLSKKKEIKFYLDKNLLITTKSETSFSTLLQQKLRWASKSKHITNRATLAIGGITFLTNILAIVCIPYIAIYPKEYFVAAWIWGLKVAAEATLVFMSSKKVYGPFPRIHSFILSALLMPFYATFVAIASPFLKFTWKRRTQS